MTPAHRAEPDRPVLTARAALRFGAVLLAIGGVVAVRAIAPGTSVAVELPAAAPTAVVQDVPTSEPLTVVHVTGAVESPGLYELPAGARVADAIAAAGGMGADAEESALNLAAPVGDGTQIYVPIIGESPPAAAAGSPAAGGLVNINSAGSAELESLPGIGPALAGRIIAHREANGPFSAVEDLDAVSGIGPAILSQLAELATV